METVQLTALLLTVNTMSVMPYIRYEYTALPYGMPFFITLEWSVETNKYIVITRRELNSGLLKSDDTRLDRLMAMVRGLDLPLVINEQPIMIDGCGYSFTIGKSPSVTFVWDDSIPEEWASLRAITKQLEDIAEEVIAMQVSGDCLKDAG